MANFKMGGYFIVEALNPDGSVAWRETVKNNIPDAALNDMLSVYLASGTQKTAFSLGLVDNAGFSAFAAADTMSSHAGWTESVAYAETTRQTWTPGAVAGKTVTNPTPATFTMNASATIAGLFLASDSTKGGTSGILVAAGAFTGGNQTLVSGQPLRVTYTCSGASG